MSIDRITDLFIHKERAAWWGVGFLSVSLLLGQVTAFLEASGGEAPARASADRVAPLLMPRPAPPSLEPGDPAQTLVEAIIQVESGGDPLCTGSAGERGLMQIKAATWNQISRRAFGEFVSFDLAYDPEFNRRAGRAYLAWLQGFLRNHGAQWQADERTLLLAGYNAGPGALRRADFDPSRLPASTRDYIRRVSALHDTLRASRLARSASIAPDAPARRPL